MKVAVTSQNALIKINDYISTKYGYAKILKFVYINNKVRVRAVLICNGNHVVVKLNQVKKVKLEDLI